jgi:hypothetical protein
MTMKTLVIIAGLTLATGSAAFAQTPAPSTDRSGGPTATAGSSAQSNAPASQTGSSMTAKPAHKSAHKAKPAADASASKHPDGTGGATTSSGR